MIRYNRSTVVLMVCYLLFIEVPFCIKFNLDHIRTACIHMFNQLSAALLNMQIVKERKYLRVKRSFFALVS